MEGTVNGQSRDSFPSGAIIVLVIAAVAFSSVLVTLLWLVINNRRRRARSQQSLPELVPRRPNMLNGAGNFPMPPTSPFSTCSVHPVGSTTLFYPAMPSATAFPKPVSLEPPPPTYEEAISAPTTPNTLNPPCSPETAELTRPNVVPLSSTRPLRSTTREIAPVDASQAPPTYAEQTASIRNEESNAVDQQLPGTSTAQR